MTSIIAVNDSSSREIFPELTRDVIDRMKDAENPRLREILSLVVSHVHAIVREAKITHDEWWHAIDFLTRAGKCVRTAVRSLSSCPIFWGFRCWSTPSITLGDRDSVNRRF